MMQKWSYRLSLYDFDEISVGYETTKILGDPGSSLVSWVVFKVLLLQRQEIYSGRKPTSKIDIGKGRPFDQILRSVDKDPRTKG